MKLSFTVVSLSLLFFSSAFAQSEPFVLEKPADLLSVSTIEETRETKLEGGAVFESSREKIILIQGYEVQSKEQFLKLVRQSLQLNSSQVQSPTALYQQLINKNKFSKRTEITLIGAATLKDRIGTDLLENFVQTVNQAQETNENISLTYWQ